MTLWTNVLKRMKLIKEMKQQSGSILVISALMLPVMLGCLGFAYDFGNLYVHKSRLQNIADAAALAGGRAYLDSQKKPTGTKDESDEMPGLMGGEEVFYQVGKTPERNYSNHWDADNAADDYISKNIVNLGTSVTSDQFSHFALKTEGMSGRVFYRIGLYEDVPLHFLPVIGMKKEQKVRAGAIALIDDGMGVGAGKALFDNLFVVKDGISLGSDVGVDAQGNINGTFDGGIVFATGKDFAAGDVSGVTEYFYTLAEKNYQTDHDGLSVTDLIATHPNMGGKAVWDNSIALESSVSGFIDKLHKIHLDLKKNTVNSNNGVLNNFTTSSIGKYRSEDKHARDNHFTINQAGGIVTHYLHTEDNKKKYVFCYPRLEKEDYLDKNENDLPKAEDYLGKAYWLSHSTTNKNLYYSFLTEGYKFNNSNNGKVCFTYVTDTGGNQIFCDRTTDTYWCFNFYRKNVVKNDQGVPVVTYKQLTTKNDKLVKESDDDKAVTFSYMYGGNEPKFNFTIKKVEQDLSKIRQLNEPQVRYSNVYHWEQEGEPELKITVDEKMAGGDYEPFYLILTGGVGFPKEEYKVPIKIKVNVSNERPFIFCNLTENEITEFSIKPGAAFKGVIYSPFAKVVNTVYTNNDGSVASGGSRKSFKGNIIAKGLEIQDGEVNWASHNFLADDSDLKKVSDDAAKAQEKRKQDAIKFVKDDLNISDEEWSDPGWFHNNFTTDEAKTRFKNAWNDLRQTLWSTTGLDMPDWPWKEGGKPTDPDQHHYSVSSIHDDTSGETLRLTNFRTEYTIEPYINPFNNLYLPE